MKKKHSRIGLISSLALHSAVFAGVFSIYQQQQNPQQPAEELVSISMEMLAARLEQPQVASAPEANESAAEQPEKVIEPEVTPKEPEPEPIIEPKTRAEPTLVEKPKPKETEKPKPKLEKPKEKAKIEPKEKTKPTIKAVEKAPEAKTGIVAKAIPNAMPSTKPQAGVASNSTQGSNTTSNAASSSGSASEINAYKVALQKALQQRANNAYPQREKMMRKTGVVTLSFSVSASGQVINVSVSNSSGNSNLDAAALKAAQSTSIGSAPPAGFPSSLIVPVRFSVN